MGYPVSSCCAAIMSGSWAIFSSSSSWKLAGNPSGFGGVRRRPNGTHDWAEDRVACELVFGDLAVAASLDGLPSLKRLLVLERLLELGVEGGELLLQSGLRVLKRLLFPRPSLGGAGELGPRLQRCPQLLDADVRVV